MKNSETLPITDIESLANSFRLEFQELEEVDFVIVGASGFLGKWLSIYLAFLQSNAVVKGTLTLVIRDPGKLQEFGDIPKLANCKIILASSISKASFSHLRAHRTIVIYAATSTSVTLQTHISSSEHVTSLPKKIISAVPTGLVTFVHLSSGGVYLPDARQLDGIPGDFGVQSTSGNPYVFEKLELERWTLSQDKKTEFVGRNPRLFSFYGPGLQLDRHFAIAEFMRLGRSGKPIVIKGNPSNLRSYLYPTDAIRQILKQSLLEKPHFSQIGSSHSMTILQVAQVVANEFDVDIEILDSQITERDNYVPQDVPITLEREFAQSIAQWANWLK